MDAKLAAQLKDIHLPPEPGIWPLPVGWWLVLVLLVLFGITIFYFWLRYKRLAPKREALALLHVIDINYSQHQNAVAYVTEISKLLRRVAMQAFSRKKCAGLSGERWLAFLQQHSKSGLFKDDNARCLVEVPYSSRCEPCECTGLSAQTQQWIKENL